MVADQEECLLFCIVYRQGAVVKKAGLSGSGGQGETRLRPMREQRKSGQATGTQSQSQELVLLCVRAGWSETARIPCV
ncbi:hypothetical protein KTAU_05850 [Thermogemmatispora aurantia]|uniref:Uncharacterized protein n=1 Tax=Thermogemmatispora aurantia TaxID=2045279 RepID=A0A5J4K5G3_9CHLR|nr:hypothetical protein KTAU_05850 [Thermogemmatispora aurantia]